MGSPWVWPMLIHGLNYKCAEWVQIWGRSAWRHLWGAHWTQLRHQEECLLVCIYFFNVGPRKEDIFLTTFYGLYFSSDVLHVTNFHLGLWGQLPCTASLLSFWIPSCSSSTLFDLAAAATIVDIGKHQPKLISATRPHGLVDMLPS